MSFLSSYFENLTFICYNKNMVIVSNKNETVKKIKKLKHDNEFLFLDSPKTILEAINCGFKLLYSIIEDGKQEKFKSYVGEKNIVVSREVFSNICSTVNSQGVCAIIKFFKKKFKPPLKNYLVLDNVQDPGNVGTLIRSAVAFGFQDIYLIECANVTNEKVVRSTMGAIFKSNLYEISKIEFLQNFKNSNLICGDINGKMLSETKLKFPLGIVVGNEGNGISNEILNYGESVAIEMNEGIESLNAGVAGSILMFESYKREKYK